MKAATNQIPAFGYAVALVGAGGLDSRPEIMRSIKTEYPQGSGKMRDAVSVEARQTNEPWTEYELEDGSTIKLRNVLLDCIRVENEYDAEGNPIYMLKVNGVMNVVVPPNLKRRKQ